MNLYNCFMAPLEMMFLGKIRTELIQKASGNVLEIGFGYGANYKYYNLDIINKITGTDVVLGDGVSEKPFLELKQCPAEKLNFQDNTFDTIVGTLVLCSVDDVAVALKEMERVLKPNGTYIFIEHIRPNTSFGKVFDKINVIWGKNRFGCQANRNTLHLINQTNLKGNSTILAHVLCYGIAVNHKS